MAGAYRALSEETQRLVEQAKQDADFRAAYASGLGCGKTVFSHERYRQLVYERTGIALPSLAELLAED